MQHHFDPTDAAEKNLAIELGRTTLSHHDAQGLELGAVVPLDQAADEAVDVYADGQLIARGEIVVKDHRFCVRITEIVEGINAVA